MPITAFLSALPSAKMSIVLPYDLLIFWPSVPGTTAASPSSSRRQREDLAVGVVEVPGHVARHLQVLHLVLARPARRCER